MKLWIETDRGAAVRRRLERAAGDRLEQAEAAPEQAARRTPLGGRDAGRPAPFEGGEA